MMERIDIIPDFIPKEHIFKILKTVYIGLKQM